MAIPSMMQGLIETEDGKVIELDSPKGVAWLDMIGSFRYEPQGDSKPYTVRKEGKNGEYWYGCRKVAGKVRKKYIGKSSEVSVAKLEEIAEALEIPPVPSDKVAEVAEIKQEVVEVAEVTEQVTESRVTALESQVAVLIKAVEALQEALPGKFESGNSQELPKVDNEVVERLQNELSNLKVENEALKQELEKVKYDYSTLVIIDRQLNQQVEEVTADRAKLLESSITIKSKLERQVQELRSQLATERADREEIETQLADQKQNSAPASEFPDAADLLNRLKAKRKKSATTLADIEALLEMIEG